MKHFIIFILLITGFQASSQELPTNYWAVKWVQTAIASPAFPHFRFAVEKRFGKDAINAQVGYTIPARYKIDGDIKGRREGYAARLEYRNYHIIQPLNTAFEMYLGAEVFYLYAHNKNIREYTADTTYRRQPTNPPPGFFYKDEYAYTRHTWGAESKFGFQYRRPSGFFLELSLGLGFKVYDNTQFFRDNPSHRPNWSNNTEILMRNDQTATTFTPSLSALGSIGYWF